MSLFAIGDVHGHTVALRALLEAVAPHEGDTVVFLGDYVDKGPDVAGTLDFLIELGRRLDCVFLRGNHDQMLLDAIRDPSKCSFWVSIAGDSPLHSYGGGTTSSLLGHIPASHRDFLADTCVNFFETDQFIFVHGGIRFFIAPADEEVERLQWTTLAEAAPHQSGKTVVCGHSAQASGKIADLGHTLCIDTGIAKGGCLTCLNLDDFSWVQASARGEIATGALPRAGKAPV